MKPEQKGSLRWHSKSSSTHDHLRCISFTHRRLQLVDSMMTGFLEILMCSTFVNRRLPKDIKVNGNIRCPLLSLKGKRQRCSGGSRVWISSLESRPHDYQILPRAGIRGMPSLSRSPSWKGGAIDFCSSLFLFGNH